MSHPSLNRMSPRSRFDTRVLASSVVLCWVLASACGEDDAGDTSQPIGTTDDGASSSSSTGTTPAQPTGGLQSAGGPEPTGTPQSPAVPSSTTMSPGGDNLGGTPSSDPGSNTGGSASLGGAGPSAAGPNGAGGQGASPVGAGGTPSAGSGGSPGGGAGAPSSPAVGGADGQSDMDAGSPTGDDGDVQMSDGCGETATLEDSPSTNSFVYNTIQSGGEERRFILRLPQNYDSSHPYRLILGFHGATNNAPHVAGNPAFFGLYELAEDSTIFIAPEAVEGIWSDDTDVTFVDDILSEVEAQLCIDTTRVIVQGFSQGAAMARTLACARPGVFRAAVGHSAGGLTLPGECEPIPYLGSLGTQESMGNGQAGQTDFFATAAGCTIEEFPTAPGGGHVCSDYAGCAEGSPVRWCSFDDVHTPLPNDSGQGSSWMPEEVWSFLSQF